jgi:tetratricopeptide (TPR) repeat protein
MMSGMSDREIIFYLILVSTNCVIAYHWAIYGFFELALDRKPKKMFWGAVFIGMATFFVGGYLQKNGLLTLNVLAEKNIKLACAYLFGPPIALMILIRLIMSIGGVPEYNRARSATQYWTIKNLKFGQILTTEGESLRNFPRAIKALEYFDKAIAAQKRGASTNSASGVISIAEHESDYHGFYDTRCPACGFNLKVPDSALGVEGPCTMCGSLVTAKTIKGKIYISAFGKSVKRTVLYPRHKRNIATALSEKALLLRMMNRLDEAEKSNDEALEYVEDALSDEPGTTQTIILKSLIIFRSAELAHVKGDKAKAKSLYEQCLAIDESIGNTSESHLIKELLSSL